MKKLIFIGVCLIFLVACNTEIEGRENVEDVNEKNELDNDGLNSVQTNFSNEVENEDFKLILKSEKQNFSNNEPIIFTAELHYIGAGQEMEVYSNASLIDFQIQNEDGTFELISEGVDYHHSYEIQKDEPYMTTFEFDKNDEASRSLLESMITGDYTIKIQASYGKEDFLTNTHLTTGLNFKISE